MPIPRRSLLAAGLVAPFVSSCATKNGTVDNDNVSSLAMKLGISATYATISGGKPNAAVALSNGSSHPVHANSVFQAASLTKPVTAFVALALAREGKLDLNAPASRYLPDGYRHRQNPAASPPKFDLVKAGVLAGIPVASLLNHTSGLPNWTGAQLTPGFEAGKRWQYSGEAYVLIQSIISAITGQDFEAVVDRYVFEPLAMDHSRLRLTDDMRGQIASSTGWLPWSRPIEFAEANAAASLHTTAGDYAKLLARWVNDETLLALTLSKPVATDASLGLSWGYGWGIESAHGGPYLWHWGNNPGYRAFAMVSATSGNGFTLLTNCERGLALARPLARATVPSEHNVFRFHMLG